MNHGAVDDADFCDALGLAVRFFVDADAEIGGVRDQAFFAGLDGSKMPSPAKASSSRTLKLPPSRVSGLELVSQSARGGRAEPRRIPERDLFGLHVGLDDRDERGFVLVDCDALFEFVFERSPRSEP